ncbi:DnaJ domain-containing protein [Curvivirga sp.]|uniref:DnaJ domain-containing protein n=1 Tax=Curvivirga sp. TaxID=2856848 RepID=UPI003B5A7134
MFYLILGTVILAAILILLNTFAHSQPANILRAGRILFVVIILALAGFFVMRGGLQFLWLAALAIIPWINRLKMVIALSRLYRHYRRKRKNGSTSNGNSNIMTRKDALKILDLEEGADEEEIKKAHRRLMQKHHPDQGGDPKKASLINQAKDILLDK